jgi:hypothetical protein
MSARGRLSFRPVRPLRRANADPPGNTWTVVCRRPPVIRGPPWADRLPLRDAQPLATATAFHGMAVTIGRPRRLARLDRLAHGLPQLPPTTGGLVAPVVGGRAGPWRHEDDDGRASTRRSTAPWDPSFYTASDTTARPMQEACEEGRATAALAIYWCVARAAFARCAIHAATSALRPRDPGLGDAAHATTGQRCGAVSAHGASVYAPFHLRPDARCRFFSVSRGSRRRQSVRCASFMLWPR